jgi:N utilization substance protein B
MTAAGAKPETGRPGKAKSGARSAARLAAVQALYQIQLAGQPAEIVVGEFIEHRFGQNPLRAPDVDMFRDIVRNVLARRGELEPLVGSALAANWRLERMDKVMQALLLSGAYELVARPDVPTAVIINEYVELSHAFFEDEQAKVAHAVLDKVAREVRAGAAQAE